MKYNKVFFTTKESQPHTLNSFMNTSHSAQFSLSLWCMVALYFSHYLHLHPIHLITFSEGMNKKYYLIIVLFLNTGTLKPAGCILWINKPDLS